jgi:hypothetical protein
MDNKLIIPWHKRIFQLRMAVRASIGDFARLLCISKGTLLRLESKKPTIRVKPRLATIRKIRILEYVFKEELIKYHKQVRRYGQINTFYKTEKVYELYGGYKFRECPIGVRSSPILSERFQDIQAVAGMERFGRVRNKEEKYKGRVNNFRRGYKRSDEDDNEIA